MREESKRQKEQRNSKISLRTRRYSTRTSMKKIIVIAHFILTWPATCILAQSNECNQKVWVKRLAKLIPKEVCIPPGYHITEARNEVDLNGDGLKDIIFDWNKESLSDGDTIFVSAYLRNADSSYFFYRTFKNLYPIYFKSYKLDYTPKKKELENLQRRYEDQYPLIKLEFGKESIKITRKGDATTDMVISYLFDKKLSEFRYKECKLRNSTNGRVEPYDLSTVIGPSVNNFTYFIWE